MLNRISQFIVLLFLICSTVAAQDNSAILRAGAAAIDISPTEFPLNMPGGFNANMGTTVHDPFYARAMVLGRR